MKRAEARRAHGEWVSITARFGLAALSAGAVGSGTVVLYQSYHSDHLNDLIYSTTKSNGGIHQIASVATALSGD